MKPMIVQVPTINDAPSDFDRLFALWNQVKDDELEVTFDFSWCSFLRQNAVAFLGGLARLIEYRGGRASFAWDTLQYAIRTNLAQQGFLVAFNAGGGPWTGNSIPYREDRQQDKHEQMEYLKRKWLGLGWVNVSPKLRDAIVGNVWEIYANAFEHSKSPIGVFTCGQHYPKNQELKLTVVDFGVGIPWNVRLFCRNPRILAHQALEWAFQEGTTTNPNGMGRGMGLDLLKRFVRANCGSLEVYSHDGRAKISCDEETYETGASWFEGTIFNIGIRCDDRYYRFASEASEGPPF